MRAELLSIFRPTGALLTQNLREPEKTRSPAATAAKTAATLANLLKRLLLKKFSAALHMPASAEIKAAGKAHDIWTSAARWQGYIMRAGLGPTRRMNHASDPTPIQKGIFHLCFIVFYNPIR